MHVEPGPSATGSTPARKHECRPFSKVAILIGATGAGKSSVINSLLNGGATKEDLTGPARVSRATTGTTEKLTFYWGREVILTDTIGFFDRKITVPAVQREFINFVLGLNIGINKFYFVLKDGKIKDSEVNMFRLLEGLFGRQVYSHATLIVTHVDHGQKTLAEYRQLNQDDQQLMEFVDKFDNRTNREPFYQAIKADLEKCPDEKVYMRIINFAAFWERLCLFFSNTTDKGKLAKLAQHCRLQTNHEVCSICLEPVLNDIFITSCSHLFHYDCLATWMEKHETCPYCRSELEEFFRFKKEDKKESRQTTVAKSKGDD